MIYSRSLSLLFKFPRRTTKAIPLISSYNQNNIFLSPKVCIVVASKMYCISDVRDLELPKTCQIEFPDPDDLLNFKLNISPDEVL